MEELARDNFCTHGGHDYHAGSLAGYILGHATPGTKLQEQALPDETTVRI